MFKTGQLVRGNVSGRYYWVVGPLRTSEHWTLQEINTNRAYTARPIASMSFTLIGNNYKARGYV